MKRALIKYWPGIIIILVAVIIALATYQDYGVSWDEEPQRELGAVNYSYLFEHNNRLLSYCNRDYGPGFELPLTFLQQLIKPATLRETILMRHLATHLFFLFGAFVAYLLILRQYKKQVLACLGLAMLILLPRIYGHSFMNSKDVPFFTLQLLIVATFQAAFTKNKLPLYLLLGFVCGYTTSVRILGVFPASFIVCFLLADIIRALAMKLPPRQELLKLLFFAFAFCATLYACFPFLWGSPIAHLGESIQNMSHFRWRGAVLLNGTRIRATRLPWYYFPEWFAISNPPVWLLVGLAGSLYAIAGMAQRPLRYLFSMPERLSTFQLLCFIMPVVAVISMGSVIYDDWRHLYFVMPHFILLGVNVLSKLQLPAVRNVAYGLCIAQAVATGYCMITIHPFHQVYFNSFVSHKPEYLHKNFELDYWGCSFKQSLEYLTAREHYAYLKVNVPELLESPFRSNIAMLIGYDTSRVQIVSPAEADYFITNYRNQRDSFKAGQLLYSIKRFNSTILGVYKAR